MGERDASIAFANTLIKTLLAHARELFEDDQMEAELPYLERLFLEKVNATLRAEPLPGERSIVALAAGSATAVDVKDEPNGEDEGDADMVAHAVPSLAVDRMLHPSGIVPRLDNVMSHANLGCAIDLRAFAQRVGNVIYEPKRHSALSLHFRRPKGTVQLYASGKLVCTGCRTESDSRACARKCAALARSTGARPHLDAFRVTNIFASCGTDFDVKLLHLAAAHGLEYNPERSAKLTWHRSNPSVVLEISSKGHVGLSGTARVQELSTAFEQVYPVLKAFSVPRVAPAPTAPAASVPLGSERGADAHVGVTPARNASP